MKILRSLIEKGINLEFLWVRISDVGYSTYVDDTLKEFYQKPLKIFENFNLRILGTYNIASIFGHHEKSWNI